MSAEDHGLERLAALYRTGSLTQAELAIAVIAPAITGVAVGIWLWSQIA